MTDRTDEEEVEQAAVKVAEFAVARLRLEPGDVLVVKVPPPYDTPDAMQGVHEVLQASLKGSHLEGRLLVMSQSWDLGHLDVSQLARPLTREDVARAGAGDWPHLPDEGGHVAPCGERFMTDHPRVCSLTVGHPGGHSGPRTYPYPFGAP